MSLYESQWVNGVARKSGSEQAETRFALRVRLDLAAGVGFEPTGDLSAASGFQDRPVRPLRHPAAGALSRRRALLASARRGTDPAVPDWLFEPRPGLELISKRPHADAV